jgi:hypothetical protein
MPIVPTAPLPAASLPPAAQLLPQVQRVTPVEPAKRVTKNDGSGQTGLREDRRRRRGSKWRGTLLDLEV